MVRHRRAAAALITKVSELVGRPGSEAERVALVIGRGGGEHYEDVGPEVDALTAAAHRVRILFLDAPDEVLVRRFEGNRRRHPMGARGVEESIADERRLLEPLRQRADVVLDTGELNVNQLRNRVLELFGRDDGTERMQTSCSRSATSTGSRSTSTWSSTAASCESLLGGGAAPPERARRGGARLRARPARDDGVLGEGR